VLKIEFSVSLSHIGRAAAIEIESRGGTSCAKQFRVEEAHQTALLVACKQKILGW